MESLHTYGWTATQTKIPPIGYKPLVFLGVTSIAEPSQDQRVFLVAS